MHVRRGWLLSVVAGLAVLGALPFAAALGQAGERDDARVSEDAIELGNGFTYQGRLSQSGSTVTGSYDFRFILYDQEIGGSQVGQTVTKASVAVAGGLFTVQLDFGPGVFSGDARWLEIAARESSPSAVFSTLSPRQPITAVPYALFARAADALALPFAAAAADASSNGLLSISQTDAGIAIAGRRTYAGLTAQPAVLGTNAGAGAGVEGSSSAGGGTGVRGTASADTATGIDGVAAGAHGTAARLTAPVTGTALELGGGAIRVTGTNTPVFQHLVNAAAETGNRCGTNGTILDSPFLNGIPSALVVVTQAVTGPSVTAASARTLVAAYSPSATCAAGKDRWVIFATGADPLATGDTFNVLVVQR